MAMKGYSTFPKSSSITGTSPSDCLVSYQGQLLRAESHPSAEKQSVYSTAPADWLLVFEQNNITVMQIKSYINAISHAIFKSWGTDCKHQQKRRWRQVDVIVTGVFPLRQNLLNRAKFITPKIENADGRACLDSCVPLPLTVKCPCVKSGLVGGWINIKH